MQPNESTHRAWTFVCAERDREVTRSETPIFRQNQPCGKSENLPKRKHEAERQDADDGRPRAIQKINAEI